MAIIKPTYVEPEGYFTQEMLRVDEEYEMEKDIEPEPDCGGLMLPNILTKEQFEKTVETGAEELSILESLYDAGESIEQIRSELMIAGEEK